MNNSLKEMEDMIYLSKSYKDTKIFRQIVVDRGEVVPYNASTFNPLVIFRLGAERNLGEQ